MSEGYKEPAKEYKKCHNYRFGDNFYKLDRTIDLY